MEREGFDFPKRPGEGVPRLPEDIGDLSDGELMRTFTLFTAWAGYANTRLAAAEVEEHEAESALNALLAQMLVRSWNGPKDDRVAVAKAERETSPEVIKAREVWQERRAYRKMLESLFQNIERGSTLVSRELTRRTAPMERRRQGP